MFSFVWNVALVINVAYPALTGEFEFGLATTAAVLDISEIIKFNNHGKSSSISKLIQCKLRDLYKLLKYFNGTRPSASNLLSLLSGGRPINFALYSKI